MLLLLAAADPAAAAFFAFSRIPFCSSWAEPARSRLRARTRAAAIVSPKAFSEIDALSVDVHDRFQQGTLRPVALLHVRRGRNSSKSGCPQVLRCKWDDQMT